MVTNTGHDTTLSTPIRVGLVGTGFVAKRRAEALKNVAHAQLVAVTGHTSPQTRSFCQIYGAQPCPSWTDLVTMPDLDLIIVATVNRDHGAIAQAALLAKKHVIVEYPLALNWKEGNALVTLAKKQERLLHVEHIELLGGVHQAFRQSLPRIGTPLFARYATIKTERPAPERWTYQTHLFGFPLVGALSRLHRLIDVFGPVKQVSCQAQFWHRDREWNNRWHHFLDGMEPGTGKSIDEPDSIFYQTCLCRTQLQFVSGLMAEVEYGKGEHLWQNQRRLEVQGERGAVIFEGEKGELIQSSGTTPLKEQSRRGLFDQDTEQVMEHLMKGTALYVTPEASVYSLMVAEAACRAAILGQTVVVDR